MIAYSSIDFDMIAYSPIEMKGMSREVIKCKLNVKKEAKRVK